MNDSRFLRSNWWQCLALMFFVVALILALTVNITSPICPEDDGFITYRYAANVVAGHGLVYNIGQHVFGSSTPLYLLWLVIIKLLVARAAIPALAIRGNVIFTLAVGIGALLLFRSYLRSPAFAALFAAILLLRPGLLYATANGMETMCFTALAIWSLWALTRSRFILSGLLAGLMVLVRPEGILLAIVVGITWLIQSRRQPVPFLAALFSPLCVWVVFASAYYGTPVYHSLLAKSRPLYPLASGQALRQVVTRLESWTALAPAGWLAGLTGSGAGLFRIIAVLLSGATALGFIFRRRLGRSDIPVATVCGNDIPVATSGIAVRKPLLASRPWQIPALLGLFVAFYGITNPLMFEWYALPLETLWYVTLVTGLVWLSSYLARFRRWLRPALVLLLFAIVGENAVHPFLNRLQSSQSLLDLGILSDPARTRVYAYQQTADWLNRTLPRDAVLAGPEIGALGYYYNGPVIDACGLVSPEALKFLPVPDSERYGPTCGAISLDLVRSLQPDVVATMSYFADLSLYDSEWFHNRYRHVRSFPLRQPLWSSSSIDIYFRDDLLSRLAPTLGYWSKPVAPALDTLLRRLRQQGLHAQTVLLPSPLAAEGHRAQAESLSKRTLSYRQWYETLRAGAADPAEFLPALAFWDIRGSEWHPEFMSYMNDRANYISAGFRFTLLALDPDSLVAVYLIDPAPR